MTAKEKKVDAYNIRLDPSIQNLLARMPEEIAQSFSDIQLIHIKTTVGSRKWGRHGLDCRGAFTFPFIQWHYYYVILLGRNRRQLSEREQQVSAFITAFIVLMIACTGLGIGLLLLYLLKSFAGIDLFPGMSLGIWDQFKDLF